MESPDKIIVLAGSQREFEEYKEKTLESRKDHLCYAYNESTLFGIRAKEVVIYGTAHERKNFWNLKKIAESRLIHML